MDELRRPLFISVARESSKDEYPSLLRMKAPGYPYVAYLLFEEACAILTNGGGNDETVYSIDDFVDALEKARGTICRQLTADLGWVLIIRSVVWHLRPYANMHAFLSVDYGIRFCGQLLQVLCDEDDAFYRDVCNIAKKRGINFLEYGYVPEEKRWTILRLPAMMWRDRFREYCLPLCKTDDDIAHLERWLKHLEAGITLMVPKRRLFCPHSMEGCGSMINIDRVKEVIMKIEPCVLPVYRVIGKMEAEAQAIKCSSVGGTCVMMAGDCAPIGDRDWA